MRDARMGGKVRVQHTTVHTFTQRCGACATAGHANLQPSFQRGAAVVGRGRTHNSHAHSRVQASGGRGPAASMPQRANR